MNKRNLGNLGKILAFEDMEEAQDVVAAVEPVAEQVDDLEQRLNEHEGDPVAHTEPAVAEVGAGEETPAPVDTTPAEVEVPAGEDAPITEAEIEAATPVTAEEINQDIADADNEDESVEEVEAEAELAETATDKVDDAIAHIESVDPEAENAGDEFKEDVEVTVAMTNESLKTLYRNRDVSDMMVQLTAFENRRLVSATSRHQFRSLAIESLEGQKASIMERVIEAFKKAVAWLFEKANSFLDIFRSLKTRRERIRKMLTNLKSTNSMNVENAFVASILVDGSGNRINHFDDIKKGLQSLVDMTGLLAGYLSKYFELFEFTTRGGIQFGHLVAAIDPTQNRLPAKANYFGGWTLETVSVKDLDSKPSEFSEVIIALGEIGVSLTRGEFKPASNEVRTLTSDEIRTLFDALDNYERVIATKEIKSLASRMNPSNLSRKVNGLLTFKGSASQEQYDTYRALFANASRLVGRPTLTALSAMTMASKGIIALAEVSVRAMAGDTAPDVSESVSGSVGSKGAPAGFNKADAEDIEFREISKESHSVQNNPATLTTEQDYKEPIDDTLSKDDSGEFQDTKLKVEELMVPDNSAIEVAIENYEAVGEIMEEGMEAVDLNDDIVEVLEAEQAGDGLSEGVARLASLSSEAFHKRLMGFDSVSDYGIGFESFSKGAYRARATSLAVESWKEKGKEMIKKIIEQLKKLGNMARYLWKQFLTLFKGQAGKIERVTRSLATTDEKKMSGQYIKSERSLKRFAIKGQALTANSITQMLNNVTGLVKAVGADAVVLAVAGSDQARGDTAAAQGSLRTMLNGGKLGSSQGVAHTSGEAGAGVYTFDQLPAGAKAVFTRPALGDGIEPGFSAKMETGEVKAASSLKGLTKSEAKSVLAAARKAVTEAENLDKEVKQAIDAVDAAVKGLKAEDFENPESAKAARKAVGSLTKVTMGETKIALKAQSIAISAALDLVSISAGLKAEEVQDAGEGNRPALPAPSAA